MQNKLTTMNPLAEAANLESWVDPTVVKLRLLRTLRIDVDSLLERFQMDLQNLDSIPGHLSELATSIAAMDFNDLDPLLDVESDRYQERQDELPTKPFMLQSIASLTHRELALALSRYMVLASQLYDALTEVTLESEGTASANALSNYSALSDTHEDLKSRLIMSGLPVHFDGDNVPNQEIESDTDSE